MTDLDTHNFSGPRGTLRPTTIVLGTIGFLCGIPSWR